MGHSHVRERDIADLDIVIPLVEQLDVADLLDNVLGEDVRKDGGLDLDIAAVRHVCCDSELAEGDEGEAAVSRS